MPSRLGLLLLAVFVPAVLLQPAAAHAERVVLRDASNDVVRLDEVASQEADDEVFVAEPQSTTTDVTRVVVDHRAGMLRVAVHVRDLRGDTFGDQLLVRLRSPNRLFNVQAQRRGDETFTALTRGHRETERACGGLVTTSDSGADTLVVSVPTTCIEDPPWVRVGVTLLSFAVTHSPELGDQSVMLADEVGVTGFDDDGDSLLGPKVRRG